VDQLLTGMHFDYTNPYDLETELLNQDYGRKLRELGPDHPHVRVLEEELDRRTHQGSDTKPLDSSIYNLLEEFVAYRLAQLPESKREEAAAKMWRALRK
jgi:hypothetical protein